MKKSVTLFRRATSMISIPQRGRTRLAMVFARIAVFSCIPLAAGLVSPTARAQQPGTSQGYLIPIGGGASYVDESQQPKESQVSLIAEARELLSLQKKSGLSIPSGACLVSYQASTSREIETELQPTRDLFVAAGFSPTQIVLFGVAKRSQAQSESLALRITRTCGLVFLPGGDQTEQMDLWSGTLFAAALQKLFSAGGILMGKSAGAAMLGSVVFTPSSSDNTAVINYLGPRPFRGSDFQPGSLLPEQKQTIAESRLPTAFLIETHTGDRERAARGAVFLAELEAEFKHPQISDGAGARVLAPRRPVVLAVDSDTGLVIQFTDGGLMHVRTIGARAVEILTFGRKTRTGVSDEGFPFVESGRSDLLLAGDTAIISADGRVTEVQPQRQMPPAPNPNVLEDKPMSLCLEKWNGQILSGQDAAVRDTRSRVRYRAAVPSDSEGDADLVDVEDSRAAYAYLTGTVRTAPGAGCGFWQSRAFDFRGGQPENRLNLARFGLASGAVDLAFSLSEYSSVRVQSSRSIVATDDGDERSSASLFVQDARDARLRRVASYVYKEFGARSPVQIGGWVDATFHIVPPGFSLELEPGRESKDDHRILCPAGHRSAPSGVAGCP